MYEKLCCYIQGYITIFISGINIERFLNMCRNHRLKIWNVKRNEDGCTFCINVSQYSVLRDIRRKTTCRLKVCEKRGLPFFMQKYNKRIMFFTGFFMFLFISFIMSTYIWNISLEGNYSYTENTIIDFLERNNIEHGIKKSSVDCNDIERLIRNNYSDITWVSAEIKGTKLIVHIKENFDRTIPQKETNPYNIISGKKAVIERIVTRSGTPLIKSGDKVEEGTVMVSGTLQILGDDGGVAATDYVCSDADIFGRVVYKFENDIPMQYEPKSYTGRTRKAYQFEFFGKKFSLMGLPIRYKKFDIVNEVFQAHIFSNYYLPFYMNNITYREYTTSKNIYSKKQVEDLQNKKLNLFLSKLQERGIQIVQNNVKIDFDNKTCRASGNILVIEQLGEVQYITDEMKAAQNNEQEGNQNEDERD